MQSYIPPFVGAPPTKRQPLTWWIHGLLVVLDGGVYRAKNPLSRGIDGMLQLNLLQLMQTPPPRRKAVSKSSFESTILPGNLCKSWFQLTLKQILFCVSPLSIRKVLKHLLVMMHLWPPKRRDSTKLLISLCDWKYYKICACLPSTLFLAVLWCI